VETLQRFHVTSSELLKGVFNISQGKRIFKIILSLELVRGLSPLVIIISTVSHQFSIKNQVVARLNFSYVEKVFRSDNTNELFLSLHNLYCHYAP